MEDLGVTQDALFVQVEFVKNRHKLMSQGFTAHCTAHLSDYRCVFIRYAVFLRLIWLHRKCLLKML